jgi:hypothetical protein
MLPIVRARKQAVFWGESTAGSRRAVGGEEIAVGEKRRPVRLAVLSILVAGLAAFLAAMASAPAASAAGCKSIAFRSTGHGPLVVDYTEWPPGHKGKVIPKQQVTGHRLPQFNVYYVPAGGKLSFRSQGTTFTIGPRTVFVPHCDHGVWAPSVFLGTISVSGKRFSGSHPRSVMFSPEGTYMPLPGLPRYTVTRHVGKTKAQSWALLRTAPGGSAVWARMNGTLLFSGKNIPCQIGHGLKIYDTGKYVNL